MEYSDELASFVGRENDDIEREFGFTHYLEVEGRQEQDHASVVNALLEFIGEIDHLNVVKTDDGIIVSVSKMVYEDVKKNLELLGNAEGAFWEEETDMCFALLGVNFFSYVFPNMIMFSADEESARKMAGLLDSHGVKYIEPEAVETFNSSPKRKLGRNDPCHCGSGKKYKKCCMEEDSKNFGTVNRV
jgi:hypothetical protein